MRESELHEHIARHSSGLGSDVVVGPGDDCAVVRTPTGDVLLLTVDQLIEGRHFGAGTPIDAIARKAVARSVSDIAAMAGEPAWSVATAALPTDDTHAADLYDRLAAWARRWRCPLVGGDLATTAGPVSLTVTVIGRAHRARGPVLRSTAKPGEGVYVTGALGGSLASGRHLTFEPRVDEARALGDTLGDRLTSMIDLSDGLGRDAGRVARASGVRIEIDAALVSLADGVTTWRQALGDGEDHELCFTALGDVPGEVAGTPITRVGRVVEGAGCVVLDHGAEHDASEMGWEHEGGRQ